MAYRLSISFLHIRKGTAGCPALPGFFHKQGKIKHTLSVARASDFMSFGFIAFHILLHRNRPSAKHTGRTDGDNKMKKISARHDRPQKKNIVPIMLNAAIPPGSLKDKWPYLASRLPQLPPEKKEKSNEQNAK